MADRIEPQMAADERTTLVEFLDYHRATMVLKASGLSDDQARARSVGPSTLSMLGLVRHMAQVERIWFREILVGEPAPRLYSTEAEPDRDFEDTVNATLADALAVLDSEIEIARAATAGVPLDQRSAVPRADGHPNLRWILVHMIEEYARHCGHADLLREAIDGTVGD